MRVSLDRSEINVYTNIERRLKLICYYCDATILLELVRKGSFKNCLLYLVVTGTVYDKGTVQYLYSLPV